MYTFKVAIFVTFIVCSAELTQAYFENSNIRRSQISVGIDQELPNDINKESAESAYISKRYFGTPAIFKRQNSAKCFESSDDVEQQAENIADIFKAESVTKCFTSQTIGREFFKLLAVNDTERIGEAFDAEVSKFCPTWPTSKKCIYDYLKSTCNRKEIEKVQESASFYYRHLAFPVLMCETQWEPLSRFFAQNWPNVGLSDCFSNLDNLSKFGTCSANKKEVHIESGFLPSFKKTATEYLSCARTVITDCASGDNSTELEMKIVLNLLEHTLKSSFDSFWSDFKQ